MANGIFIVKKKFHFLDEAMIPCEVPNSAAQYEERHMKKWHKLGWIEWFPEGKLPSP